MINFIHLHKKKLKFIFLAKWGLVWSAFLYSDICISHMGRSRTLHVEIGSMLIILKGDTHNKEGRGLDLPLSKIIGAYP